MWRSVGHDSDVPRLHVAGGAANVDLPFAAQQGDDEVVCGMDVWLFAITDLHEVVAKGIGATKQGGTNVLPCR